MNPDTATLRELDRRHLWHPFTQMKEWLEEEHPVIVSGEGCWLVDSDGNRYLDGVAAIWTNVHGHCRKEINEAVKAQVDRLEHSTLLGLASEQPAILAGLLAQVTPGPLTRVFYSDNGSTAMEIAIKMAFQYFRQQGGAAALKTRFICLKNAYHGDTLGAVSIGGIDLFHEVFRPLLFPAIHAPSPYCYRCECGGSGDSTSCALYCLQRMEELVRDHAHELAAVVVEPLLQGAGGMIVHPRGYLKGVRDICDRHGILLIADEVATGFGRTGTMFACQQEGVCPDIMALSKGISGGYLPLAATMTTERIFEGFLGEYRELRTFFHGHTFTGNPIACAAAIASMGLFETDGLLESLQSKISHLGSRLARLKVLPHVGDTRQAGMAAGIELVSNKDDKTPFPWEEKVGMRVCLEARRHGIFLRPLGNVIVIFPPLVISLPELDFLMDGVERAIEAVTVSGG
jgi:adenosylmethionine-8-amino-7-oxononanoate aminotransferase